MANKRIRKKIAKRSLKDDKAFKPRKTFRSNMSIQSTLFDPNTPKSEKLVLLAESNLNRLAFVITKPSVVNLQNLTEEDVKFMASNRFFNKVDQLQEYFRFDRSYYRPEKHKKIENIIRTVMNKYYDGRGITSTKALDNSIKRLIKQLEAIERKYPNSRANPFVIVYYNDLDLR